MHSYLDTTKVSVLIWAWGFLSFNWTECDFLYDRKNHDSRRNYLTDINYPERKIQIARYSGVWTRKSIDFQLGVGYMSFVYAINSVDISIMSDTKIYLDENLKNLWNTESERQLVKQIGLIKSVIVSPNIVVCYAGNNIDKAAELLREIKSIGNKLDQIIDVAYNIHEAAPVDDIEFIIGYCDKSRRELISIKNKQLVRNCKVAWIGSWDAYNEFKRMENEIPDEKIKGRKAIASDKNGKMREEPVNEELARIWELERIFRKVVESGVDPTVGGMTVRIKVPESENTFQYMAGISIMSSNWPQQLESGDAITFYQGVEKGSFCCNIYQSKSNFCCYIYEDNLGIVYTDEEEYVQGLEGMKFPKLYKMDKEKFDLIAENNGAYSCVNLM